MCSMWRKKGYGDGGYVFGLLLLYTFIEGERKLSSYQRRHQKVYTLVDSSDGEIVDKNLLARRDVRC